MSIMLQCLAVCVNVYIAFCHNTKRIYWASFLFNLLNLLLYLWVRDITAIISYIGITVRSFIYIHREQFQTNSIPVLFCMFHIFFGVATMKSWLQVCTILAPCAVCISMWYFKGQFQKLRIGNILNSALWFIYNWASGLYIVAGLRLITVGANTIAFIRGEREAK